MTVKYIYKRWHFDRESLNADVRAFCQAENLSLVELAEMLGLSKGYFSNRDNVSIKVLCEVCDLINSYPSNYFVLEE